MHKKSYPNTGLEVAIIGMSVRMPGANTLSEFWDNLINGEESITFFSDEQLKNAGVAEEIINDPQYIKAKGIIDQSMAFEPDLFNFNDREATLMDPQLRIIHECVFQALNDAGHQPDQFDGPIGLYGGSGINLLWSEQFIAANDASPSSGYEMISLNSQEYLFTRVAHSLNLTGPALTIQTACSSSLVALHIACQGLIAGDCDMAVAGGVQMRTDAALNDPDIFGYLHEEGMILSEDGHCRPFDQNASGTSFSDGAGFVVLKRLEDAVAENDHIYAVIKGTGTNNDGDAKVGFMAPSAEGQKSVIKSTQIMAETAPETIGYIEAHGTGTVLGDPIEVKALSQVFTNHDTHVCHLGSVKSNIGHLGAAAGVAGLIKTVLSIYHGKIPPTVHYSQSNPNIDFDRSPFVVNAELADWTDQDSPFRAGVSSFGIGGTNAHAIVEEYVAQANEDLSMESQPKTSEIVVMSATSESTLLQQIKQLSQFLKSKPDLNIHDVAHSLNVGRRHLSFRLAIIADDTLSLITQLDTVSEQDIHAINQQLKKVIFMFPGQGAQYHGMFKQLYQSDQHFKQHADQCFDTLTELESQLLKDKMWGQTGAPDAINDTDTAQLCLFISEYAMAHYLMDLGIQPTAMIGHSLGEYVAATLAGVFTLKDALQLVKKRGELMAATPNGAMVMAFVSPDELSPYLSGETTLTIATINTANNCVVSGAEQEIDALVKSFQQSEVAHKQLPVNKAYHSSLMQGILPEFSALLQSVKFGDPSIPFISNVTGLWYQPNNQQQYWVDHLRQAVQFNQGIDTLAQQGHSVFIEVGPGVTLSSFVKNHGALTADTTLINTSRHRHDNGDDIDAILQALCALYLSGVNIDWKQRNTNLNPKKVPLPGMVFKRSVYQPQTLIKKQKTVSTKTHASLSNFYQPIWQLVSNRPPLSLSEQDYLNKQQHLLLLDDSELSNAMLSRWKEAPYIETIKFSDVSNQAALLEAVKQQLTQFDVNRPLNVLYVNAYNGSPSNLRAVNDHCTQLIGLLNVLNSSDAAVKSINVNIISSGIHPISGQENINPVEAMLDGLIKVANQEMSTLNLYHYDVLCSQDGDLQDTITAMLTEMCAKNRASLVAFRNKRPWQKSHVLMNAVNIEKPVIALVKKGHYFITGGLGNIALTLAKYIANEVPVTLTLLSRQGFSERKFWPDIIKNNKEHKEFSIIQTFLEIEKSGSVINVMSADVADFQNLEAAFTQVEQDSGPINGVFHCAGNMTELTTPLSRVNANHLTAHFNTKLLGTNNLQRIIGDRSHINFCVLMSSLSAIMGGIEMASYATANRYMDACVDHMTLQTDTPWFSINWDAWDFSADIKRSHENQPIAITADQAPSHWKQMFSHLNRPQLIHCLGDFHEREKRSQQLNESSLSSSPTMGRDRKVNNAYVEPSNEIERLLADIWQERLAINKIGTEDNFFELGGDSLIAVNVFNSMKKHVDVDSLKFSISDSFMFMTIKDMSNELLNRMSAQSVQSNEPQSVAEEGEF